MNGTIDENIHPCKGCEDYIPPKDCKSNGGCGRHNIFYEHMSEDFTNAVETIMEYCQYEDCDDDCQNCPHTLAEIRCGDIIKEGSDMSKEDRELIEARDECVRLGFLEKQGKNLDGTDTYVKTEKGERIFKELLEDARNGIVYN